MNLLNSVLFSCIVCPCDNIFDTVNLKADDTSECCIVMFFFYSIIVTVNELYHHLAFCHDITVVYEHELC
jgi:hypothetical protein